MKTHFPCFRAPTHQRAGQPRRQRSTRPAKCRGSRRCRRRFAPRPRLHPPPLPFPLWPPESGCQPGYRELNAPAVYLIPIAATADMWQLTHTGHEEVIITTR
ncbi:hypothetical protein DSL92_06265 [Billgrantia gudaonensis]|uniref:Uncharacterized protein n=1 Tax=Billgrantia gudaonensis TaxID=376427 RepID=A0A3S0R4Y0_9GAMM|nr:hypothetical protein DSL92_06265 [Halomonas gudaonensis]